MLYKKFQDLSLSTLGMGTMRLPVTDGKIDAVKAEEMLQYAYDHGINYFDTAFGYHSGESERFVGQVLRKFPRDSFYLASKMPGHMMTFENGKLGFKGYMTGSSYTSIQEIFELQLAKCQVDYFDFYLLHNVCESSYNLYTDKSLGIVDYLAKQVKAGRIRHLGMSSHGRAPIIDRFLSEYEGLIEFVQIQINYLDWSLQQADEAYEVITKHHLPVMAMEPCRGGKLADLPDDLAAQLKAVRPNDSIASWAFRFLQSLDNMQVVLSGMTTLEQLKENIALFSKADPTDARERALLGKVVASMLDSVPCTACRYCTDGCPMQLDIPHLISLYNQAKNDGLGAIRFNIGMLQENQLPSACIACGACSQMCPQNIDIPGVMQKFTEILANG